MSPYRDPIAIHGVRFPRLLPPESDIYLDLVSGFRYLEHRLLYIRTNRERWLDRKRYRNRWVILAFLVVYISSDFSSFLLQALDTVVILSIGVVSSDHSHSRLISWLNCFFSFSFCTVFELFTLFTLFFFFFSFLFLILLLYAKNSFTSPPRQHVYGFPPGHIPQVFPGHFEKFLDAFGAGACRCYVRYTPLANVAFGRVSYTSVPAHRMKSAFLIQSSDFIVQTIFVAILTDSPLVVQAIYGQREWFHTKMFQQLFIGLGEIVRTHAVHRSMTIFIVLLVQVLLRSWH